MACGTLPSGTPRRVRPLAFQLRLELLALVSRPITDFTPRRSCREYSRFVSACQRARDALRHTLRRLHRVAVCEDFFDFKKNIKNISDPDVLELILLEIMFSVECKSCKFQLRLK